MKQPSRPGGTGPGHLSPPVWLAIKGGVVMGAATTRRAAMNVFDRPYWPGGGMIVVHRRTDETWARIRGSWTQTRRARPRSTALKRNARRERAETRTVVA